MIEQEYIDIFTKYRDVIDSKAVEQLNNLRDNAFDDFQAQGFPTKKLEDYSYVNIAEKFKQDYGININRAPINQNPYKDFKCNVPSLSANLFYVQNDLVCTENMPQMELPKGVFAGSINDFAKINPKVLEDHYGKIAATEENAIVAFNTMFVQDAFVIYVPKNVAVEKPIQVINLLQGKLDYLINRRVLVIAEENAQVKILACDHALDSANFLTTQVVEIFAEKNAIVDFYELEENSDKTTRLSTTYVHQSENSNVLINNMTLNSGLTRNNYHVELAGEHCEAYVCGMVIADKKQYVDNFVFLDHAKPNCQSTQLFKYILLEDAIGAFCGRIIVARDSQKTLAYQTNNNLCVSPTSRMYSKPQLEIYADDVKCSHGLTTGQLDEEALFYLRARGINEKDAKLMLMKAFTSDVFDHIRIPDLRERLDDLVEKRLKGETAKCGNCAVCK